MQPRERRRRRRRRRRGYPAACPGLASPLVPSLPLFPPNITLVPSFLPAWREWVKTQHVSGGWPGNEGGVSGGSGSTGDLARLLCRDRSCCHGPPAREPSFAREAACVQGLLTARGRLCQTRAGVAAAHISAVAVPPARSTAGAAAAAAGALRCPPPLTRPLLCVCGTAIGLQTGPRIDPCRALRALWPLPPDPGLADHSRSGR